MAPVAPRPRLPLAFNATCKCGKVGVSVRSLEKSPPLRLVCYCKDCRGYNETLNRMALSDPRTKLNPPAELDNWGGVDWTSIYPRDITILEGQENLLVAKIREKSGIRQVYTNCCYTPMFRFGGMSVLMNSGIMVPEDSTNENLQEGNGVPVTFRIIGRDAWKKSRDINDESANPKPRMSFSVPLKWFWTMPFRINKELMDPMPLEIPKSDKCDILKDFQEGSSSYESQEKI